MFEWKDEYSVNIEEIDKQHQRLLGIGQELYLSMENSSAGFDQYDIIKGLLKEMYDYTVYHFNYEEDLMEKSDYLDLGVHRFQHKLFVKKLEDIDLEELDSKQEKVSLELLNFLANWIENHILQEDQKYVPVLLAES